MPIDIGQSLKNLTDYTVGNSILNGIFSSSLVVSLLISILIVLLVVFTYPSKKHVSYHSIIKLFMYVLITVGAIQLIHSSVIKFTYKKEMEDPSTEAVFEGLEVSSRPNQSFESMLSGQGELYGMGENKPKSVVIQKPHPVVTGKTNNPLHPGADLITYTKPQQSMNGMNGMHSMNNANKHPTVSVKLPLIP